MPSSFEILLHKSRIKESFFLELKTITEIIVENPITEIAMITCSIIDPREPHDLLNQLPY
jgi:hypothetical protein